MKSFSALSWTCLFRRFLSHFLFGCAAERQREHLRSLSHSRALRPSHFKIGLWWLKPPGLSRPRKPGTEKGVCRKGRRGCGCARGPGRGS